MSAEQRYVVAGHKPWNRRIFEETLRPLPGEWVFASTPAELDAALATRAPRYVFFLHWSHKVPADVLAAHECVVFHMTDVPYGRGGSPLQNLIVRGHRETMLSALRMTEAFDAGPVYMKTPLSLEGDTAEAIYIRATELAADMIRRIAAEEPETVPQQGEPTVFRRRTPAESAIPPLTTLDALHDFIRMLDADGYPHAFIEHEGFRYTFSRAARYHGRIVADVTITPIEGEEQDT